MKCPFCGDLDSKVIDSRHSDDGLSIRRRRECLRCQRRFTTYESVEVLPIIVVKRDGSRQAFDRNKILNSMVRAFDKRKVEVSQLERIATEIEQTLQNTLEREVSTDWTRWPTSALPPCTAGFRMWEASSTKSINSWRKNKEITVYGQALVFV